ncbi:hypothetical protein AB0I51_37390 [Streptomyces sp. NPDC050549]|uniref:hypothetical protein n=1 Tax=Streptomyces sp. NPDC050549 TaxID=3155406 RepID=UPI0034142447
MIRSTSSRLLLTGTTATALLAVGRLLRQRRRGCHHRCLVRARPLTQHNSALFIDSTCVDYVERVDDVSANQLTLYRGATRSWPFTDFINSGGRKNITVAMLDYQNTVTTRHNLRNAHAIRYTNNTATSIEFDQIVAS